MVWMDWSLWYLLGLQDTRQQQASRNLEKYIYIFSLTSSDSQEPHRKDVRIERGEERVDLKFHLYWCRRVGHLGCWSSIFIWVRSCSATQSRQTFCDSMDYNRQVPLSMKFFRQEHWSWLSFPTPGYLPNPGTESASLASLALAGGFFIGEFRT